MLRKTNFIFKNFCKNKIQIKEETPQEKYKDFSNSLKDQEAFNRKADRDVFKFLNSSKINIFEIPRAILQTNFLKRKNVVKTNDDIKIDLDLLDKLDFKAPITLYEIDVAAVPTFKSLNILLIGYTSFTLLFDIICLSNFNILFGMNKLASFGTYFLNTLTMITYLFVRKAKNKVLTLEYIHENKSVVIRKYKNFSSSIQEIIIPVNELEMFYSQKVFETGFNLRYKGKTSFWLGVEDEGIWHNKQLLENIFGYIPKQTESLKDKE